MTQLLGPALAFYVRHFDEAEAMRELQEPPPGISWSDWTKVLLVVRSGADSGAKAVIKHVLESDIAEGIRLAGRFKVGLRGQRSVAKHWAMEQAIGEEKNGLESLLLGLAIDGDEHFGPWLGIFLNYRRQRATMLRRAAAALSTRRIECFEKVESDRGWTGQLILGRFPLQSDSTSSACSSWARNICHTVLVDMWQDLAMPASDAGTTD